MNCHILLYAVYDNEKGAAGGTTAPSCMKRGRLDIYFEPLGRPQRGSEIAN